MIKQKITKVNSLILSNINKKDFYRKYNKQEDGHWIWTLTSTSDGYGAVTINKVSCRAHVVSFALTNGYWPKKNVLHTCDIPLCGNPDHLYEGTQMDNRNDMLLRNRQPDLLGKTQPISSMKLTPKMIEEIRSRYKPGLNRYKPGNTKKLATKFGVSKAHIRAIASGIRWSRCS